MARRGVGLAAFSHASLTSSSFSSLSSSLSAQQLQHLTSQLQTFRSALSTFATHHRGDIARDPAFRTAFHRMCAALGVDPLAGPRRGGFWSDVLGLGDWYFELAVQVVDVCVSTRERNGGVIEMGDLLRRLTAMRGGADGSITPADVLRALAALEPLGCGYTTSEPAPGRTLIRSLPRELDTDQTALLAIAADNGGWVNVPLVELLSASEWDERGQAKGGWGRERAGKVLEDAVMTEGTAWVDDQCPGGEREWWFPAAIKWEEEG